MATTKTETTETTELETLRAEMALLKSMLISQSAGTEAVKVLAERSAPRENPHYVEISAFTYPDGRPKPSLSRPTFFAGIRQYDDSLTPAEIEAFNSFDKTKISRHGQWKAEVRQNGSAQELHVDVPIRTPDERMSLPSSLLLILLELQQGQRAADPASLVARVAELEQTLAALTA